MPSMASLELPSSLSMSFKASWNSSSLIPSSSKDSRPGIGPAYDFSCLGTGVDYSYILGSSTVGVDTVYYGTVVEGADSYSVQSSKRASKSSISDITILINIKDLYENLIKGD